MNMTAMIINMNIFCKSEKGSFLNSLFDTTLLLIYLLILQSNIIATSLFVCVSVCFLCVRSGPVCTCYTILEHYDIRSWSVHVFLLGST